MGMKIEMRDAQHLWITFNPAKGDPREVIIDQNSDVRICDGQTVVKVRFAKDKPQILDVLQDDIFLHPVSYEFYHNIERVLSHSLQPEIGDKERIKEVTDARDNLRELMRRMGWKGQF